MPAATSSDGPACSRDVDVAVPLPVFQLGEGGSGGSGGSAATKGGSVGVEGVHMMMMMVVMIVLLPHFERTAMSAMSESGVAGASEPSVLLSAPSGLPLQAGMVLPRSGSRLYSRLCGVEDKAGTDEPRFRSAAGRQHSGSGAGWL